MLAAAAFECPAALRLSEALPFVRLFAAVTPRGVGVTSRPAVAFECGGHSGVVCVFVLTTRESDAALGAARHLWQAVKSVRGFELRPWVRCQRRRSISGRARTMTVPS